MAFTGRRPSRGHKKPALIESEMNRGVWLDRYETEVVPALKGAIWERSVLYTMAPDALSEADDSHPP